MDKIDNFELEYWQTRVDDMQVIIDSLRTERDNALDAASSLHQELEQIKSYVKQSESIISRLRNHIAQGVEL
jgi:predicted  nucleic acid-binding Zn-ribbon protein